MSAYAPQPFGGTSTPALPDYSITFADAVRRGFRRYLTFDGRAGRAEFWYWYLFATGVLLILVVPSAAIGSATASADGSVGPVFVVGFVAAGLFYAAVILPTIAIACRRLHDAGFSGLYLLLGLVTGLIPLIMCMLPTSPRAVQYGPPGLPEQPAPYGVAPGAYGGQAPGAYGQAPPSYGGQAPIPHSAGEAPGGYGGQAPTSYGGGQPGQQSHGQPYPGPVQPPPGAWGSSPAASPDEPPRSS